MALPAPVRPAILDANGIIGLAKSGCFPLLPRLFQRVLVPRAVVAEVTDALSKTELTAALEVWLFQTDPSEVSLQRLPSMKSETDRHLLALALEHRPVLIVTVDRGLARRARQHGVETISAPRVVSCSRKPGLFPLPGRISTE